jgi:hypothetical protein
MHLIVLATRPENICSKRRVIDMPLYTYVCSNCRDVDQRIAGFDDHTALCVECGELMIRLDDPFDITLWDDGIKDKEEADGR